MNVSDMLADGINVEAYWEKSPPDQMYQGSWKNHRAQMQQHGHSTWVGVLNAVVDNGIITISGNLAHEEINVTIPNAHVGTDTERRIPIHSPVLGDGEILLNSPHNNGGGDN